MVPGKLKMTSFDSFWDTPLADLLQLLQETPAGLTSAEAKQRLHLHGPNSLVQESQLATLVSFLRLFANPLVIMLLVASAISPGCSSGHGATRAFAGERNRAGYKISTHQRWLLTKRKE